MTVQEVVLDLLSNAGVYGFELGGVPEDEAEIVRAVAGVNQAIQTIYADGPLSLKYDTRAVYLNPPTQITLTCAQGSKAAAMIGPFAAWMRGCSIQVEGDSILNRITDIKASTGGNSAFTFLRPYTGASGSHTCTVYGDCAMLDSDVAQVFEPVTLAPNTRLFPASSKERFFHMFYWSCPITGRQTCFVPFYSVWEKVTGVPQQYRVERRTDSAQLGGSLYLSFNPMPTWACTVTFDIYRKPTLIDRGQLDEEGGDDPNEPLVQLPPEMIEMYLLPIARWKYVSMHPEATLSQTRQTLRAEYDEAMTRLKGGSSIEPQIAPVRATYI